MGSFARQAEGPFLIVFGHKLNNPHYLKIIVGFFSPMMLIKVPSQKAKNRFLSSVTLHNRLKKA
jgi:hypothetical protein